MRLFPPSLRHYNKDEEIFLYLYLKIFLIPNNVKLVRIYGLYLKILGSNPCTSKVFSSESTPTWTVRLVFQKPNCGSSSNGIFRIYVQITTQVPKSLNAQSEIKNQSLTYKLTFKSDKYKIEFTGMISLIATTCKLW